MEEPLEQADQMAQEELRSSPEDRYYQRLKDVTAIQQDSRQEIWELYQALQEHHAVVQTCYETLEMALREGRETKTLWDEYHEAITKHRLLANRFRLAMQQRLVNMLNK